MSVETKKSTPTSAEQAKPAAEQPVTPIWLIVLFAIAAYWGMMYLDNHSGGFDPKVYAPFKTYAKVNDLQPHNPEEEAAAMGKLIYGNTCVACHQANGKGTPGQFPPLAGSDWVNHGSPNKIIRIVLNGASGHITVNGLEYNNTMVPWKDTLSDDKIAAVLTYVRQNKEWGNNAPAVTPAQVHAIREKIKDQNAAMNPDELIKMPDAE